MDGLRIHGVRGTIPVCGRAFEKYGGETTCFSISTPDGLLVIDAGSGLHGLRHSLEGVKRATFLFTHFHLDHVIGLPAFPLLWKDGCDIEFAAHGVEQPLDWQSGLNHLLEAPYWPLSLRETPAETSFVEFGEGGGPQTFGVEVRSFALNHPQPCWAYRLRHRDLDIVIATDHEPGDPAIDAGLEDFCRGASHLIADAQYDPAEFDAMRGRGHGHWRYAAQLAERAGVGKLLLAHHDPERSDAEIERFVQEAREIFPDTAAAAAGMILG